MESQTTHTKSSPNKFKPFILTLVALVALLGAFQIGIFVGYRKASFSYRWGDNYHRMFAGPRRGFMGMMPFDDAGALDGHGFMDAHGIYGTVLTVDGNTLIIKDKDQTEKKVDVGAGTTIRRGAETVALTDLKTGEHVVIIGEPDNQGQIDAKFIRAFPQN